MAFNILAINPGSTSTKIAVYNDEKPVFSISIEHSPEDLARFNSVQDQFHWRKDLIEQTLKENGIDIRKLNAVIGRGGIIMPIESMPPTSEVFSPATSPTRLA